MLVKLTMRFLEVVLTGVADVEDMCDLEGLNNARIGGVVPVSQPKAPWENLVGVVFGNRAKIRQMRVTYGSGVSGDPLISRQWKG